MRPCPSSPRGARLFFLLCLLLCLAARVPEGTAAQESPAAAVVAQADRGNLAASRPWRTLLHVKRGLLGERSLIDDPRFFLAPRGKTDPAAELQATIEGLFRTDLAGDDHPACRFPARAAWLREQLGLDETRLPRRECPSLQAYLAEVDPRAVTLVFPAGYSNSPATMYGHTLLRIDSGAESGLLATAVSYAARTDTSFGPLYALKGLFGLYPGYYYVNPYYEKITQYSHIDSRDIWEYSLGLSPAEALHLARHIWELRDLGSRYYFFDENCASSLLLLLEVARPSLELEDGSTLWAIPLDTIRRILHAGIVTDVAYRPSRATRLRAIAAPLSDAERALAAAIASGESRPEAADGAAVATDRRARILDAATELHQASFFERRIRREEYADRLIGILRVRSRLETLEYSFPPPARPDEGHRSLLLGGGPAFAEDHGAFALRVRPVYHGLIDPRRGYQEGAAISFGDTLVELASDGTPRLERFRLIDILSLAPIDHFERPTSWKIALGFEREELGDGRSRMPFAVTWAGGWAVRATDTLQVYALAGIEGRAGGALEHWAAAGLSAHAGALWHAGERWTLHAKGDWQALLLGERSERWRLALEQGFAVGRNDAIELTVAHDTAKSWRETSLGVMWNHYL